MQLDTALPIGVILGAIFVGLAYALPRYTRQILAVGLILAALPYVHFSVGSHQGPLWLAMELAGVALYGAIAVRGLRGSLWWLVAGWALHPIWDIALHYAGPGRAFAPDWYTVPCLGWDLVVAGVVAYYILFSRWVAQTSSFAVPRAAR
ncbi:MAG TPA: DUF6010 family protein [Gemmatimonadaceae bacterium]|jgi:hypothetical protein|nr:DUF6010 family protein [Gemmatimonadaceae bacterium]